MRLVTQMIAYWLLFGILALAFLILLGKMTLDSSFRRDMLAQNGEASVGPLSVQGATFTVVFLFIAFGMFQVAGKTMEPIPVKVEKISESEKTVYEYYSKLNEGIAGETKSFEEAWSFFTPSYQGKKRKKYSPDKGYVLPRDYHKLYSNSEYHDIISCSVSSGRDDDGRIVYHVIFKSRETLWDNPYYDKFIPTTSQKVSSLEGTLTSTMIEGRLFEELSSRYIISNDFSREEFKKRVGNIYLNRLIGPRLLVELAADFNLEEKKLTLGEAIGADGRVYQIYQGNKIILKKVGKEWKIDGVKLSTFCAHRVDD